MQWAKSHDEKTKKKEVQDESIDQFETATDYKSMYSRNTATSCLLENFRKIK